MVRLFSYLWTSKIKSMDEEEIEMAKSQRLERIENEVSTPVRNPERGRICGGKFFHLE